MVLERILQREVFIWRHKMRKLLMIIFLFLFSYTCYGQGILVDDSWVHGSNKVTLTKTTDNVGIGSSTPTQKLDVKGTVRATSFLGDGSKLTGISSGLWETNNVGIDTFNKVGIGTVVPNSQLQVNGGGIAGEMVNKGYELIGPTPILGTTSEIDPMAVYQGSLYVPFNGTTITPIYKWDGNTYSQFYNFQNGAFTSANDLAEVAALFPYNGSLLAAIAGNNSESGAIYIYNPLSPVSNLLQFLSNSGGTTQSITVPNDSANNAIFGSTSYSVEYYGRIEQKSLINGSWIIGKAPTAQTSGYLMIFGGGGQITVGIHDASSMKNTTTNNSVISPNNNHDVIFSWTSGSAPVIYVDGVAVGIATSNVVTTPNSDTGNQIEIGNRPDSLKSFAGTFRRIRIWRNYAVTSGDAVNLAAGNTISTAATGQYLFTEGSGTTTADSSGNGNTATINGGVQWNTNLFDVFFAPASDEFIYSLGMFKGNLLAGQGFHTGKIYSYNGSTWTTVDSGTRLTLITSFYNYKGMEFASGQAGSLSGGILSSSDGVTWNTEFSGVNISRLIEFSGHLYALGDTGSTPQPIYQRNDTNGTWFQIASLPNATQCWGAGVMTGAFYVGCTATGGGLVYKSYDGVNFTLDFTNNSSGGQGTEVFAMNNYNGSLYMGYGFNGTNKADLWRKTDSVGQQTDLINSFINKLSWDKENGLNWPDDKTFIKITPPVHFESILSAKGGINWLDSALLASITAKNINWADPSFGTNTTGNVLTAQNGGLAIWSTPSSSGPWTTVNTYDALLPNNGNVGIGTANTQQAQMTIGQTNVTSNTLPMTLYQSSGSILLDNTANAGTDLAWSHVWEAIKFTTGLSTVSGNMCVHLKSSVATTIPPTGQYEIRLFTDSAGAPGSAVAGSSVSFERWGPLTTSYTERCTPGTGTLSASTSYWAVLEMLTAAPSTGIISMDTTTTGTNTHAFSADGVSWTTASNEDGYVRIVSPTPTDIILSNPATPSVGGVIDVTSFMGTPLKGTSLAQNGVEGIAMGQGQGGLFIGHLGAGITTQSNYGWSIQAQTIQGVGISDIQSGTMISNSDSPVFYAERNQTIGTFTSDGPVARIESNVTDTGDLLDVVKQSNPKIIITSTGNATINGTGGLKVTDSSQLSSELVTNGTFTGSATGWTLNTGWTYNSNNVSHATGNTATMTQTLGIAANKTYLITATVGSSIVNPAIVNGTFTIGLGGITCGKWDDTGKFGANFFPLVLNFICTVPSSSGDLTFTPDTNFSGTIDTVSVKNILGGNIVALGNVGIGTALPGVALDVNGTARLIGLTVNGKLPCLADGTNCPSAGSGTVTAVTFTGDGTVLSSTPSSAVTTTGSLVASLATQTANTVIGATGTSLTALPVNSCSGASNALTWTTGTGFGCNTISGGAGTNYWTTGTGGNIGIGTTNTVGIGTLFGNAALTVMNGNVGIGTWNPTNILQVNGTIGLNTSSVLTSTTLNLVSSGGSSIVENGGSTAGSNLRLIGGAGTNSFLNLDSTSSGSASGDFIIFKGGVSGGTTIATMFGTGNVGIGSANPNAILDVEGTVNPVVFGGVSSGSTFKNVGIGTFNPGQALDVKGTVRASLGFVAGTGAATITGDANGNVGIGSANPGSSLDVIGTIRALSSGTCTTLYSCNGGVDVGVIQTSSCSLCPGGTCSALHGCF